MPKLGYQAIKPQHNPCLGSEKSTDAISLKSNSYVNYRKRTMSVQRSKRGSVESEGVGEEKKERRDALG